MLMPWHPNNNSTFQLKLLTAKKIKRMVNKSLNQASQVSRVSDFKTLSESRHSIYWTTQSRWTRFNRETLAFLTALKNSKRLNQVFCTSRHSFQARWSVHGSRRLVHSGTTCHQTRETRWTWLWKVKVWKVPYKATLLKSSTCLLNQSLIMAT